MVAAMGDSCNVFTDAKWMVNAVPKKKFTGICVGDDGVVWHDDTGEHLTKFLSTNNEVNDVGPTIQSVGAHCQQQ
jgi:exosome complex RNA-binding protein Rrp4